MSEHEKEYPDLFSSESLENKQPQGERSAIVVKVETKEGKNTEEAYEKICKALEDAIVKCRGMAKGENPRKGRNALREMNKHELVDNLLKLVPKVYRTHMDLRVELRKLDLDNTPVMPRRSLIPVRRK